MEAREGFTRMNVMHIWAFTKQDLISLGLKNMWPQFGVHSDKETVPIALVQQALTRIALILGVKIRIGCRYTGFKAAGDNARWSATADCVPDAQNPATIDQETFEFDSIVDGTGKRGIVRTTEPAIGQGQLITSRPASSWQGSNYAFTCNFARFKGDHRDQFTKSFQFAMAEFQAKKVKIGVIVYFRSLVAHYVIATVGADTLQEHGVAKDATLSGDAFTSGANINKTALMNVATMVAEEWEIPHKDGFFEEGPDSKGNLRPSVALFEFTKMQTAEASFRLMEPPAMVQELDSADADSATCEQAVPNSVQREGWFAGASGNGKCKCNRGMQLFGESDLCIGRKKFKVDELLGKGCSCQAVQPLVVVGDSMLTPFWPAGTGINRGFATALDATVNMINAFEANVADTRDMDVAKLASDRFIRMKDSDSSACSRCEHQSYINDVYAGTIGKSWSLSTPKCPKVTSKGPFEASRFR